MSRVSIYKYLHEMINQQGTDLYLTVGLPPSIRCNDEVKLMEGEEPLTEEDIQAALNEILTSRQKREFDVNLELNLAIDIGKEGRFRINVFRQRQHTGMVIRHITSSIPNFEQLRLPMLMEKLSMEKRGLVVVCGMTSSGKSTSIAAMVDARNQAQGGHIITIEDPIEFYHDHKKGLVTQREVGIDTNSYVMALRNSLRQKPDVIVIGEIRDPEVMEQTLAAAETGHLCLTTLHATNSSQAIERIINFFPEDRHLQVRSALAMNLRAVIAQRLIRAVDGTMVVALEVLLNEGLIKELILSGDSQRLKEIISSNTSMGMISFDQSIFNLYANKLIDEKTAVAEADVHANMEMKIQQHKLSGANALFNIDTSRLSL